MFRSILHSSSPLARAAPSTRVVHRAFSASGTTTPVLCPTTPSNAKKQFIVIARDYQDPEAQNRRTAVRPKHLEGAKVLKKSGALQLGGALLSDHSESGKMIGSVMIFSADSEEEVKNTIEKDLYVTGKVWEHWQIMPFRQAPIE